ncbi:MULTISPECIES: energy transducer TonB [unclassified Pseudomonas]|uniref:energy transducer TonB n=1 Tax=unclassified Pseudomonas TaxID=196821 RepID=UPI0020983124|nr:MULTISPECIES: energy transducer TonB [unclassified Pseudomonas]MCO7522195.1 energy transducer TonB [Pseudomonas sp. 1]MCO7539748.1 energy transducer TonB [Pseudomonas sp. VA159-2]
MTLPADIPADLLPPRIRPVDRLGFTLFLAAVVHLALILGVGFTVVKPSDIRHTMDITLATFKSEKAPEKADFQAQDNQQGSGTLDKKALPKTTEAAPFQDSKINKITPPPATHPQTPPAPAKAVVATQAPKPQKVEPRPKESKPQPKPETKVPAFDSSQLSSQIASLEAELSHEQQLYAKRPRIHRLNAASTLRDKGAWYKEEWRKKVERIGNLNYPEEARRQQMYGSLRMMVSINRDGSLYEVLVLESSGQPVLDQAAQRIVRLAAPFAPFTGDLAEFDRLEIIRTWRFARGDKLSSN